MFKVDRIRDLKCRLEKIGIKIHLVSNFPWVYLDKINGVRLLEKFQSDHAFSVGTIPIRRDQVEVNLSSNKAVFAILNQYTVLFGGKKRTKTKSYKILKRFLVKYHKKYGVRNNQNICLCFNYKNRYYKYLKLHE